MKPNAWIVGGAILVAIILIIPAGADQKADESLAKSLRESADAHIKATAAEDIDTWRATFHVDSPMTAPNLKIMRALIATYDLKYEINSFNVIGSDADYAYTRVIWTTSKVTGPAFRNNKADAIWIFRKEKGAWKLWTSAVLSYEYLAEE